MKPLAYISFKEIFKIVTMETFFGKRSLLINIKIKAVMNKNIFYAIFRFISLNHFQTKFL